MHNLLHRIKGMSASQVRLVLRLAAQVVTAVTALAVSHPAWAGAVGTLTAIEGILQAVVRTVDPAEAGSVPADNGVPS